MIQPLTYTVTPLSNLFADNYTFSAKERDSETGLSYFGSRYYSSDLSIWLNVDPMSDDYPNLSPYVYCNNNPLSLIDFYGEDFVDFMNRLSEDPPHPPTDQNNPQELPEVVITPKPSSNTSSKSENVALNAKSKATVLTLPFPFVLGNVIECITATVGSVWSIISIFPVLFKGDSSPTQYEKSNGKNEQHGDGGRALEKADKQIKDLEKQMKNAKSGVEKRRIKKKIERIKKDAQQKQKGVNHSNGNKR